MKQILAVAVLMCVTGCASVGAQTKVQCADGFWVNVGNGNLKWICPAHNPMLPTPDSLPTALSAIKAVKKDAPPPCPTGTVTAAPGWVWTSPYISTFTYLKVDGAK